MAGYSPTVLELTPSDRRGSIPSVLEMLHRNYNADLRLSPPDGPRLSSAGGAILLGADQVVISLEVTDCPTDPTQVHLSVEMDEQAYEAAFDISRLSAREPGKRALIDFCVDFAAAAHVEGFRLRFSTESPSVLTIDELIEALTSVDRAPGLVSGIAESLPLSSTLDSYWPNIIEKAGFLVVEFIR